MATNKNANLHTAKKEKNDEFYTQLTDIEKELKHYKEHFKGKIVYCNCDDCFESNFFKYFALNFKTLGLKKLITTCYAESQVSGTELKKIDLWGNNQEEEKPVNNKKAYKIEINVVDDFNNDGQIDIKDIVESLIENKKNTLTILNGNGSYDSEECIALLEESDIVATNPPFSLFGDYVDTLMKYNKKFIILGNRNAFGNNKIFEMFKNNTLWAGISSSHHMLFIVPESYAEKLKTDKNRKEGHGQSYSIINGKVLAEVNACWFTNLTHNKRNEELILYKTYNAEEYPKYDNYDAINVNKVTDIPCDYDGVMGVPITFLDKYNPNQFEIVGNLNSNNAPSINGKNYYTRIAIKRKEN